MLWKHGTTIIIHNRTASTPTQNTARVYPRIPQLKILRANQPLVDTSTTMIDGWRAPRSSHRPFHYCPRCKKHTVQEKRWPGQSPSSSPTQSGRQAASSGFGGSLKRRTRALSFGRGTGENKHFGPRPAAEPRRLGIPTARPQTLSSVSTPLHQHAFSYVHRLSAFRFFTVSSH